MKPDPDLNQEDRALLAWSGELPDAAGDGSAVDAELDELADRVRTLDGPRPPEGFRIAVLDGVEPPVAPASRRVIPLSVGLAAAACVAWLAVVMISDPPTRPGPLAGEEGPPSAGSAAASPVNVVLAKSQKPEPWQRSRTIRQRLERLRKQQPLDFKS